MKAESKSRRLYRCPRCGFEFDISYARVFACSGCPSASLGDCGMIKCPACKHEFQYERSF
ncbi:MAG: hypothetical protein QXI59_05100 [Candidatus Bathyarchaeia archaeon]|nr:hypothetical protein [Candidatus Bathyarchaeota archaeon]